jgi:hypothetical protein
MRIGFDGGGYRAAPAAREPGATRPGGEALSPEERAEVVELRKRDAEVRAHEAAHQAAAGAAGGGASFTYTTGPDGKRYAIGGEVPVQIRSGHTPEETIRNAARVRAAALAPAEPSAQDRAVAAEAAAMEAAARAELMQKRAEGGGGIEGPGLERSEESARSADARAAEADASLLAVQSQTRPAGAGWRHLHTDGCAGCSARVAAYR